MGLLFSQPQFRFQSTGILIASRFSPWSTGLILLGGHRCCFVQAEGSTRKSTPHILVPITTGFWRLQRFFSRHVRIWFSSISRAGRITGWGSVGERCSPQGVTRLASLDSLATNGLGRGGIVRRPRSSVASMAFRPSACKRITNAAASATRTTDSKDRPERSGAESSGG